MRKIIIFFIFIFIFSQFQLSNESCSSKINPANLSECSKFNGPNLHDELCCIYSAIDNSISDPNKEFCHSVPYSSRMEDIMQYDVINDTLYKVNCNNESHFVSSSSI